MRHDAPWKRTLTRSVRHLLGVPEEESLPGYLGERGARAVRSFERLLQGLGIAPPPSGTGDATGESRAPWPEPRKFDLGPDVDRGPVREHIPWGYGENRITAMPVDPDRLFVYWELTDDAITAARRGLGDAGETAWPSLRVYDVTGRIFDGSNAHAYFDHRVERHDRQWFFSLGRPGHSVCVDVGMKSLEGYFVRIARSSRVDLPRAEAAPSAPAEWMTVRVHAGGIEGAYEAAAPSAPAPRAIVADGAAGGASKDSTTDVVTAHAAVLDGGADARRAVTEDGWFAAERVAQHAICRRKEGIGDVERTSWQAGPFAHAVTPPRYEVFVEHSDAVRTVETPAGRVVIEQPWSVTILGVGAHVARRVIGRWQIVRTVSAPAKQSSIGAAPDAHQVQPGAPEALEWRGASEVRMAAGSEQRLGGASEELLLGASELRFGGASERLAPGASERRWGGASERTWLGASEVRYAGASERNARGGSSGERFGGSGERFGGSEERLGGSEERLREGTPPAWQEGRADEHRIDAGESSVDGARESGLGGVARGARSARASWQAFAAAGSRLVTPPAGGISPSDRDDGAAPAAGASATEDLRESSSRRGSASAARE